MTAVPLELTQWCGAHCGINENRAGHCSKCHAGSNEAAHSVPPIATATRRRDLRG